MIPTSLHQVLADGLAALNIELTPDMHARLVAYAELLLKWNRVYNLTALRTPEQAMTHHLLDSLAILPHLGALHSVADVGSGGGLPGIPLAIARPELSVTSIETVGKKATFQQQARIELGLSNFSVRSERVENVRLVPGVDAVVSRAFSSLHDFVSLTRHLLRPGGTWLAMKGVFPQDEVAALPPDVVVQDTIVLKVPGLEAERHLLKLAVRDN